jgi:hypothetical protein
VERPGDAHPERLLEQALHRREAGRARHEDQRPLARLAQDERADRALEAHEVADLGVIEQQRRELAARHAPHVQLDEVGLARGRRERVRAPVAVGQDDVEVLPGLVRDLLPADEPQRDAHHVVREFLQPLDARRVHAVPRNGGSASNHSPVAVSTNCARRSHGSMYPLTPDAQTSHSRSTPVIHENARKPR